MHSAWQNFLATLTQTNSAEQSNKLFYLSDMGIIKVQGADAKKLLQGQFTCNLDEVTATCSSLGAHCNPQGRIISLFRIILLDDACYLLLPKTMVTHALNALQKYAVFFKVTLSDVSDEWVITALVSESIMSGLPQAVDAVTQLDQTVWMKINSNPALYLCVAPEPAMIHIWERLLPHAAHHPLATWHAIRLHAKIPEIYPETSTQYLVHELMLHERNAVSFTKGCYTGQEIIARMQHKGKIKFHLIVKCANNDSSIQRNQDVYHADQVVGRIVDYVKISYNSYLVLITATQPKALYLNQSHPAQLMVDEEDLH